MGNREEGREREKDGKDTHYLTRYQIEMLHEREVNRLIDRWMKENKVICLPRLSKWKIIKIN